MEKHIPEFLDFATMLVCVVALVWYRTKRKFNKEPFKGAGGWIDRNLVELILAAIAVPDFMQWIERFGGG